MYYIVVFILLCIFLVIVHLSSSPSKPLKTSSETDIKLPPPWESDEEETRYQEYLRNPPTLPVLKNWEDVVRELRSLQDQTYMCSEEVEDRLRNVDRARQEIATRERIS